MFARVSLIQDDEVTTPKHVRINNTRVEIVFDRDDVLVFATAQFALHAVSLGGPGVRELPIQYDEAETLLAEKPNTAIFKMEWHHVLSLLSWVMMHDGENKSREKIDDFW